MDKNEVNPIVSDLIMMTLFVFGNIVNYCYSINFIIIFMFIKTK